MAENKTVFKKSITYGGDVDRCGWVARPELPSSDIIRSRPASADLPLSSLAAAESFVRRFLDWCASVGVQGEVDLPRLQVLAYEFSEIKGIRPITNMAFSKALSRLQVPKRMRVIADHEKGLVSARRRDAKRPRITVYNLSRPRGAVACDLGFQSDLFD